MQNESIDNLWNVLVNQATTDRYLTDPTEEGNPIADETYPVGQITHVHVNTGNSFLVFGQVNKHTYTKDNCFSNIVMTLHPEKKTITISGDFSAVIGRAVHKLFNSAHLVGDRVIVSNHCRSLEDFKKTMEFLRKK